MKRSYGIARESIRSCIILNPFFKELYEKNGDRYETLDIGRCYTEEEIISRASNDFMWLRMNGPGICKSREELEKIYQMHLHMLACGKCIGHYDRFFPDSVEDKMPRDEKKLHTKKGRRVVDVFLKQYIEYYRN